MTTVLIVRHGETEHNKGGIMQGHLDVELNDTGREQARKLSLWLASRYQINHIYSSPLARARVTADFVAEGQSCHLTTVDDLKEIKIGLWQGLTSAQAAQAHPEVWQKLQEDNLYTRRPEGESYWDLYQRVSSSLMSIVEPHNDSAICIVTHGGCVRSMLDYAMSAPLGTFSFVSGLHIDNTGLSILEYSQAHKQWGVRTINSIFHL